MQRKLTNQKTSLSQILCAFSGFVLSFYFYFLAEHFFANKKRFSDSNKRYIEEIKLVAEAFIKQKVPKLVKTKIKLSQKSKQHGAILPSRYKTPRASSPLSTTTPTRK